MILTATRTGVNECCCTVRTTGRQRPQSGTGRAARASGNGKADGMGHGRAWWIKAAGHTTVREDKAGARRSWSSGMGNSTGTICCLGSRKQEPMDTLEVTDASNARCNAYWGSPRRARKPRLRRPQKLPPTAAAHILAASLFLWREAAETYLRSCRA